MFKQIVATALPIVALTGCTGIEVSDGKNDLKGVPFYAKVPIATQDTIRATSELAVQLKISEVFEADEKSKVVRSTDVPFSGAIRLPDTPENRKVVDAVREALSGDPDVTYESTVVGAKKELENRLFPLVAVPVTEKTCAALDAPVFSNSWAVSMVADPKRLYIVTKQPFIGSSNTAFKFSGDGTMTEASAEVTNDTAKTLLALFPITAKLTKQWGLNPPDDEKAKIEIALAFKEYRLDGAAPTKKRLLFRKSVKVDVTISTVKTVYTLRRAQHLGQTEDLNSYLALRAGSAPLALCDGFSGANGVQLVSVASPGDQADDRKADKDAKAWQVQGSVMPPMTNSTGASGEK